MGEQKELPLPYEFEELKPEEKALINSTLGYMPAPYIRLGPKGYMVYKPYKKDAANIYNMPLRPTDVFVASYQRAGTTWTQELVWIIANDLDYEKAIEKPLTHRYSFLDGFMAIDEETLEKYADVIAKIENNFDREKFLRTLRIVAKPVTPLLAAAPLTSSRFIKTHLPMSLLPPKLLDTAKVVYVARDPRDVAVSCYYHARLFKRSFCSDFKDFWNIFRRDLFSRMPFFEHVKEAWDKRHDPNMLFLFYEDLLKISGSKDPGLFKGVPGAEAILQRPITHLSKDLPSSIRRVADFFGKQLNEEQMNRLCDHLSENFKNNKSVNYEDMRETGILAKGETFVRKGNTGGWRAYFDEEMTQQADQWIKENLRNSDLRYPHMEQ